MSEGDLVAVSLYGGSTAIRRVIEVREDSVVLCSEEEFQKASVEGREPMTLAFPKEDVVAVTGKKGAGRADNDNAYRGSRAGD